MVLLAIELSQTIGFVYILFQSNLYSKNYPHKSFQEVPLSIKFIIGILSLWHFSGTKFLALRVILLSFKDLLGATLIQLKGLTDYVMVHPLI